MNLAVVENIARQRLGVDPASLGPTVLARAVEERMRAVGAASIEAYLERLDAPA